MSQQNQHGTALVRHGRLSQSHSRPCSTFQGVTQGLQHNCSKKKDSKNRQTGAEAGGLSGCNHNLNESLGGERRDVVVLPRPRKYRRRFRQSAHSTPRVFTRVSFASSTRATVWCHARRPAQLPRTTASPGDVTTGRDVWWAHVWSSSHHHSQQILKRTDLSAAARACPCRTSSLPWSGNDATPCVCQRWEKGREGRKGGGK